MMSGETDASPLPVMPPDCAVKVVRYSVLETAGIAPAAAVGLALTRRNSLSG